MNFLPEYRVKMCELSEIREKEFIEDVNCLRKWLLEQPHLPKIKLSNVYL